MVVDKVVSLNIFTLYQISSLRLLKKQLIMKDSVNPSVQLASLKLGLILLHNG